MLNNRVGKRSGLGTKEVTSVILIRDSSSVYKPARKGFQKWHLSFLFVTVDQDGHSQESAQTFLNSHTRNVSVYYGFWGWSTCIDSTPSYHYYHVVQGMKTRHGILENTYSDSIFWTWDIPVTAHCGYLWRKERYYECIKWQIIQEIDTSTVFSESKFG